MDRCFCPALVLSATPTAARIVPSVSPNDPLVHFLFSDSCAATARLTAARLPPRTPTKSESYESGRKIARRELGHPQSFTDHSRFPDKHFGPSRRRVHEGLADDLEELALDESERARQDKIASATDVSALVRRKGPLGTLSMTDRVHAALSAPRSPRPSSFSPKTLPCSGLVEPQSTDERAVEALVARSDRDFDADMEDADMDLYQVSLQGSPGPGSPVLPPGSPRSPTLRPNSPLQPGSPLQLGSPLHSVSPPGGLGMYHRATHYTPLTRQVSRQGPSSISPQGSPEVFVDAVEYVSSPRLRPRTHSRHSSLSQVLSPPSPNAALSPRAPASTRRQTSISQVLGAPSNAALGSQPSTPSRRYPHYGRAITSPPNPADDQPSTPTRRPSIRNTLLPSSHHWYGPGDAPRRGGRGGRGGSSSGGV